MRLILKVSKYGAFEAVIRDGHKVIGRGVASGNYRAVAMAIQSCGIPAHQIAGAERYDSALLEDILKQSRSDSTV